MNEQRQQAYLELIQTLLDCPSGQETEILQGNQELVDAELVRGWYGKLTRRQKMET